MLVHNSDIAALFNRMADLLEIEGANQFRIRAYRNAARVISGLPQSVSAMMEEGKDLTELPGIGKDLAGKIEQTIMTGTFPELRELEGRISPELADLTKIAGLGPKRARILHDTLGITSIEELRKAVLGGKVREIRGFGKKIEQTILDEIGAGKKEERIMLPVAEEIAGSILDHLRKEKTLKKVAVAGSFRRRKETVGDLDILVTCESPAEMMDHFVRFGNVLKITSKGETRSSIVLQSGLHVDIRIVPEESYGAALHYFTGSKAHNIAVRKLGLKRGLKVNEYGVFEGERRIAGQTEEEVYAHVGLPFIEPELREDWGEIDAAQSGRLPRLITLEDIRGDLHTHTRVTDGRNTLEEMAKAARGRGYEYIANTEHSKRVAMARGLDEVRLAEIIESIDQLNGTLKGFSVLKGIEVDILEDGSLDLPDSILSKLDLTVCSVHYGQKLSREKQTERIIRAMDNPYFTILAHPTGRLIGRRPPYDVDMEKIVEAAKERGCFLEVNAQPDRLDLADNYCKMAKDAGVKMVISTDAHSINDLDFMRFGIGQARRGWLEAQDVINTRSLAELKKILKRK